MLILFLTIYKKPPFHKIVLDSSESSLQLIPSEYTYVCSENGQNTKGLVQITAECPCRDILR